MEPDLPSIYFTSESHPLRVDFISSAEFPVLNGLGMTFAPGKQQLHAISGNWRRDLPTDLERMRAFYKVDVLVSVMESHEFDSLGIAGLRDQCAATGIEWLRYEVVDGSVPKDQKAFADFVSSIVDRLRAGKRVVIHCKGGLGRTGLTAACVIIAISDNQIGWEDAMNIVRSARPGTIENLEQERFLSRFAAASTSEG
jgi:protein-tyrosine phosphatase